jgi:ADP-ribose pyrophosphatase YjhB (NUDIX family)
VTGRGVPSLPDTPPPLSVKGVCLDGSGQVLVCRNWRRGWELPGGRPLLGERLEDCLVREVREETGLDVFVRELVAGYPFEVLPGRWVDIVVYGCEPAGSGELDPVGSGEHAEVGFRSARELGGGLPDSYREAVRTWQRQRAVSAIPHTPR